MAQAPQTGTLEQVVRCLKLLALSPAFEAEMHQVVGQMGAGAFAPGQFVDANGATYALNMNDLEFGDPATWVPAAWAEVQLTEAVPPGQPPFPRLYILGQTGRVMTAGGGGFFEADQRGVVVGWSYAIDFIAVAGDDRAEAAERAAYALMTGWERLVRRNENLGGLVELIAPETPPAPGGSVAQSSGNVAGVLMRFRVFVKDSLV